MNTAIKAHCGRRPGCHRGRTEPAARAAGHRQRGGHPALRWPCTGITNGGDCGHTREFECVFFWQAAVVAGAGQWLIDNSD